MYISTGVIIIVLVVSYTYSDLYALLFVSRERPDVYITFLYI